MAYFRTYRACFHFQVHMCGMWVCMCILHKPVRACVHASVQTEGLAGHTAVSATVTSGCQDKCHLSFLPFAWGGAWDGAEMWWALGKPPNVPRAQEHLPSVSSSHKHNVNSQVLIRSVFPAGRCIGSTHTFLGFTPYPQRLTRKAPPSQEPTHPRSHYGVVTGCSTGSLSPLPKRLPHPLQEHRLEPPANFPIRDQENQAKP